MHRHRGASPDGHYLSGFPASHHDCGTRTCAFAMRCDQRQEPGRSATVAGMLELLGASWRIKGQGLIGRYSGGEQQRAWLWPAPAPATGTVVRGRAYGNIDPGEPASDGAALLERVSETGITVVVLPAGTSWCAGSTSASSPLKRDASFRMCLPTKAIARAERKERLLARPKAGAC